MKISPTRSESKEFQSYLKILFLVFFFFHFCISTSIKMIRDSIEDTNGNKLSGFFGLSCVKVTRFMHFYPLKTIANGYKFILVHIIFILLFLFHLKSFTKYNSIHYVIHKQEIIRRRLSQLKLSCWDIAWLSDEKFAVKMLHIFAFALARFPPIGDTSNAIISKPVFNVILIQGPQILNDINITLM